MKKGLIVSVIVTAVAASTAATGRPSNFCGAVDTVDMTLGTRRFQRALGKYAIYFQ
jgi:hypothetical protein